jgi:TRAP-type transport system periplasmic protein
VPSNSILRGVTRRTMLAGSGAAVASLSFHRTARAADFVFKLGHDQPVDHPQNIRAMEAAANIARESGGRLTVHVFPNSQLGGDTQMLAQIRSGALELVQMGTNILANVVPAAALAALPFAFKGYQDLWSALDGDLGRYIQAKIATTGLHAFDKGWDSGFRNVFTSDHVVRTASDIKGVKLRVPEAPIQVATFKALGASPTPVNNSDLYMALQTRLVDGAEVPLINIETARYYEVTKYLSLTRHQPTPYTMLANAAAWRRLPNDLQEILARNLDQSALQQRNDIASGEAGLEQKLKGQGLTIIEPDHASFRDVVRQAGLFTRWRETYGAEPFDLLEKTVGPLT